MKVTYDKKVDAMYIYLTSKRKKITETKEIGTEWIADYAGKELVGLEILNASKILGPKLGLKTGKTEDYAVAVPHKIG